MEVEVGRSQHLNAPPAHTTGAIQCLHTSPLLVLIEVLFHSTYIYNSTVRTRVVELSTTLMTPWLRPCKKQLNQVGLIELDELRITKVDGIQARRVFLQTG
jgi:hypothetical protein